MTLNENWKLEGGESRTEEYRTWRTELGLAGVCDLDQVEYRYSSGRFEMVAIIEIAKADPVSEKHPGGVRPGKDPAPAFFEAVLEKVGRDRPQGQALRYISNLCRVPMLVVVYIDGLLRDRGVWVYRIGGPHGWTHMSVGEYRERLSKLKPL